MPHTLPGPCPEGTSPDDFGFLLDKETERLQVPTLLHVHIVKNHEGEEFYLLSDYQDGNNFLNRGETLHLIEILQEAMANISADQIANAESNYKEIAKAEWVKNNTAPRAVAPPRKPKHGYVYVASAEKYCKIGMSKNPIKRISMFDVVSPFDVQIVLLIESDDMEKIESELHGLFAHRHVRGEWFNLSKDEIDSIAAQYTTIDPSAVRYGRYSHFLANKDGGK